MANNEPYSNPFAVQTPEGMSAEDVISLFVEELTDFHQVPKTSHTFINGPRGSGKSMIFRYLEPDCQSIALNRPTIELPFYSIYVPIKETELNITELARLTEAHGNFVINEHLMTINIAIKALASLRKNSSITDDNAISRKIWTFYNASVVPLLRQGGADPAPALPPFEEDADAAITHIENTLLEIYAVVLGYLRRIAFPNAQFSYSGPLYGYLDFLKPFLKGMRTHELIPPAVPIFLLIDDADNLNLEQTKILNTWVSYRTTKDISLKLSIQQTYKTFKTATSKTIDNPHDFSMVNIYDIYTSQKNKYRSRVEKIVEKRLRLHGINVPPHEFFPPDVSQEKSIASIKEKYKADWEKSGRGARPQDDADRYSRPDYIKSLRGTSKSGSTYSYSGFDQLVHVSSGVIRYFLEPASLMFALQKSLKPARQVTKIEPGVQNRVVREQADEFLFDQLEKLARDEDDPTAPNRIRKLRNLIDGLGALFQGILLSGAAERRVFSVAMSDSPDDDVRAIFDLGVKHGYFHRSTIGNKEGTGRTDLYILSRRLAPVYTLDPTGFAGYKWVTNDFVRQAIFAPKRLARLIKDRGVDEAVDPAQPTLFDGLEKDA